jgi:hypothetical protein
MGPELLRVKDLAKRSHKFTIDDYNDAIKALDRIYLLKDLVLFSVAALLGRNMSRLIHALGEVWKMLRKSYIRLEMRRR